jgi:hypothetical protein
VAIRRTRSDIEGRVCPRDGGQIILFVTRIKQKSFEQFNDYISGEYLFWQGESKHENDERIVRAEENREEIHLFYREIHHSDFEYKGLVELIDHNLLADQPSKFVFRFLHDQSAGDDLQMHQSEINVLAETERESVIKARIGQGILGNSYLKCRMGVL